MGAAPLDHLPAKRGETIGGIASPIAPSSANKIILLQKCVNVNNCFLSAVMAVLPGAKTKRKIGRADPPEDGIGSLLDDYLLPLEFGSLQ